MRIVVKIGTNVLTNDGDKVDFERIRSLVFQLAEAAKKHEVILISSGAVAAGRKKLGGLSLKSNQVYAAVGQPLLFEQYNRAATEYGIVFGQCLVLRHDFTEREKYENFLQSCRGMLAEKVIPIINENDVLTSEDITVGDNDILAAIVAIATSSDKLVLLTNQGGLFNDNPAANPSAKVISEVKDIDFELEKLCRKETSSMGRGGMISKVRAAKHAAQAGIETVIASGGEEDILAKIMGRENCGTKFLAPTHPKLTTQKRWLMAAKGFGQMVIDDGAVKALQNGKSLLLPGIIKILGSFEKNEVVEVFSKTGKVVAYGKVNYGSEKIWQALVARKTSKEAAANLEKEVIHRDYMVVGGKG